MLASRTQVRAAIIAGDFRTLRQLLPFGQPLLPSLDPPLLALFAHNIPLLCFCLAHEASPGVPLSRKANALVQLLQQPLNPKLLLIALVCDDPTKLRAQLPRWPAKERLLEQYSFADLAFAFKAWKCLPVLIRAGARLTCEPGARAKCLSLPPIPLPSLQIPPPIQENGPSSLWKEDLSNLTDAEQRLICLAAQITYRQLIGHHPLPAGQVANILDMLLARQQQYYPQALQARNILVFMRGHMPLEEARATAYDPADPSTYHWKLNIQDYLAQAVYALFDDSLQQAALSEASYRLLGDFLDRLGSLYMDERRLLPWALRSACMAFVAQRGLYGTQNYTSLRHILSHALRVHLQRKLSAYFSSQQLIVLAQEIAAGATPVSLNDFQRALKAYLLDKYVSYLAPPSAGTQPLPTDRITRQAFDALCEQTYQALREALPRLLPQAPAP